MKEGFGVVVRMTQADVDARMANNISGTRIEIIDANGQKTGVVMESGAAGAAPSVVATANDVQQAVAASLRKVTLAGPGSVALSHTAHNGAEVHAEAGITECTMALTSFQITGQQQTGSFWLFNYSGTTLPLKLGAGWSGGISMDGDVSNDLMGAGTLVDIPHATSVHVVYDADGWARSDLLGIQVTQEEIDGKAALVHGHPTFIPSWAPNTPVFSDEIRRANVAVGSIVVGDIIQALDDFTTGAVFDTTEIETRWTTVIQSPFTVAMKENVSNKVTTFSSPTNTQYPSALLVSNQLAGKMPVIVTSTIDANSTTLQDNTLYVATGTGGVTNGPNSWWAWAMYNYKVGTYRFQMFFGAGDGIWMRNVNGTFTGATWTLFRKSDFTDWTTYTPVVTSESGAWSNYNISGRYRIVDRMLTVTFALTFTGTPTAADGFYVSLPSGLTMNASVMSGGASWDTDLVGFGVIGDSGVISGVPTIITTRTTTKVLTKYYNAAASSFLTCPGLTNTAPWNWTTNDTIAGQFTVPIIS